MNTVTPEQAVETYERTVRDEPRYNWAPFVVAISNSLAAREWIEYNGEPACTKEAYEILQAKQTVSMADEKDRP